jgi:dolichol kinase
MMLQSIEIFISFTPCDRMKLVPRLVIKLLPTIITSALLKLVLDQTLFFSVITPSAILVLYYAILVYTLKAMPHCFTFGEATIVAQGVVTFLYNCFLHLPNINEANTTIDQLNIILQLGLLGVMLILAVTHIVPFCRRWFIFYPLLLMVIAALCLTAIANKLAVVILWDFVFSDIERSAIVGGYILFLTLAGSAVWYQVKKNQRGSTATRKIFHILIVLVYLPGLVYQCYFLYVASVVIFAILIVLELARVIQLYPVADALEAGVAAFIDEQDAGNIALTPLYLLVGCSLPIWIHNSPCDMTDSSGSELLPLLAGVLSIGIGDTFASIVGSKFGRHKWRVSSQKSVEGTLASIVMQSAFIYLLIVLQLLDLNTRLMALCGVAVITNALVEAFTSQVDNLVLPIVTYIILAYK